MRTRTASNPETPGPVWKTHLPNQTVSVLFTLLCFLLGPSACCHVAAEDRLPRTDLLVFHDKSGEVKPVRSRSDWLQRRAEIVRGMEQIMGPLPSSDKRCPLNIEIREEREIGSCIRRLIYYQSEPNNRVPALAFVPREASRSRKKFPAVLALHPTDSEYGHRVVAEQLRPTYRAYARDLAERGYVVIAPAYPHLANYAPNLKALGYQSGTMKAIWDNIRALDLLDSLPYIQKGKYAAIGHSLGGHNAIYTAVFDDRIKIVVSSCGFDSYVDYMDGKIEGWTSNRYMPKLLEYKDRLNEVPFDFHELIGALAPRPVFVNAPIGDSNFKWRSVDEIIASASKVYSLYHVPKKLQVVHPDCGHDFPEAVREEAYQLIDKTIKGR